jgi:sugar phosphate permease
MHTLLSAASDSIEKKRGAAAILTGLTFGHGVFHFMQQSFAVMLPAIKETFGINPVQIGVLMTAREIAMGVSSLPGGILSDRLRRYRGIIMAACMALYGLSWLLVGFAPISGLSGLSAVAVPLILMKPRLKQMLILKRKSASPENTIKRLKLAA